MHAHCRKKKKKKGCPLAAYCYGIATVSMTLSFPKLQGRCFAPEMTILLDGDQHNIILIIGVLLRRTTSTQ